MWFCMYPVEHSDKEFTKFWIMANYMLLFTIYSIFKNYTFVLLYVQGLDFIHCYIHFEIIHISAISLAKNFAINAQMAPFQSCIALF